ncbi:hypothetical protein FA13DRAFT_298039 [Coprinellus micaceus]|uniref:Uncharacterized protein n=1 Tax=Coprinellus micaceus TaxID=71717 RepID=A0A4Y7SEI1_COPMI|nr:hypothetical protein FA13DRAFT_298039 [Coprinellus micaceus]
MLSAFPWFTTYGCLPLSRTFITPFSKARSPDMPVTQQTNRQVGGPVRPPKQGPDTLSRKQDPGPSRHPPAVPQAAGSSGDTVASDIRTLENMLVDASTLVLPPDPTAAHEFLVDRRQKLVEMSLQIVKNFKNGVKDLDKYGCSPRLKQWIAELAHDMHVNGRGPRPLDMKMIKKPPLVSVVSAGRPPRGTVSAVSGTPAKVAAQKPQPEATKARDVGVDVEMEDRTGEGKGTAKGKLERKTVPQGEQGEGQVVVREGVPGKEGIGVGEAGRPKQTPWPRPPIMAEDESEVEGTSADGRRKGKGRLVERPGGREGKGSVESGGMEVDGTVRKRKTPQRDGEDEGDDGGIPLAEKVPSKKRKVTGRPRDEVGEDVHNDETHEKVSTTVRHRNSTDGIDRRVQVIDGASFFVVPCGTWCGPNNQLCGAGSGPKIACDHCRKRKAPCDKSVKKKRALAGNGEPSSKGEIEPKKGQSAGKKGKAVKDEKEGGVVPGPSKQRDVRERTTVVHGGTSGPVPQAAPDPGKGERETREWMMARHCGM